MNAMSLLHLYDFYFLEAMRAGLGMAKSANPQNEFRHSFAKMEADVESAFKELCQTMSQRIRLYLFAAALGEARHARGFSLEKYIKNIARYSRESVYAESTKFSINSENTKVLIDVFSQPWKGSFGGRAWKTIVEAMNLYGKISDAAFIDHCVDLEHNNGTVFSKDARVIQFQTGHKIHPFLDLKFQRDILSYGIEAELSNKVYRMLQRYNNVVSPVNLEKITNSLEWLSPFDIQMGNETLELAGKSTYTPSRRNHQHCEGCGDRIDEEDHFHYNDDCLCESCYDSHFELCAECNETVRRAAIVNVEGKYVCKACAKNELYAARCEGCGKWTTNYYIAEDGSDPYCENCQSANMIFCRHCEMDYEDIQYHNEHRHADSYCKECQEVYQDHDELVEHILEEHYEPVELQEAEGFDNPFEPLEPYYKQGTILVNGENWEVWYAHKGLVVAKNKYGFHFVPMHLDKYFSTIMTIQKAVEIHKNIVELVGWTTITDMDAWKQVPQSTKDEIEKFINS